MRCTENPITRKPFTRLALAAACLVAVVYGSRPSASQRGTGAGQNAQRPDPCEQLFDVPGQAHGLNRQCSGKGGGAGVAKGDFNGDGFGDLAVGAPFEDVAGDNDAGAVHVFYGSASGLTATNNQVWTESLFGCSEPSANFGFALASGDFNGDGRSDLAIGVPHQSCSMVADSGGVYVIYGSSSGLDGSHGQHLVEGYGGRFGAALVWADFNGDGYGDLAIGKPDFNRDSFTYHSGTVRLYYGSPSGLHLGVSGYRVLTLSLSQGLGEDANHLGVGDLPESDDHFGSVLAAGDVNGDGYDDLIIGVPDEDVGSARDAGLIHVVSGSPDGFKYGDVYSQATTGVAGAPEDYDRMGWSLAVGDFDNDGAADVAVGVPFEDIGDKVDAGAVQVFYGGVFLERDQFFDQSDFSNTPETGDHFGWSLAAGKFDSGNYVDLAIGSPGEDVNTSSGSLSNVGIVIVVKGSSTGLQTATGLEGWILGGPGLTQQKAAGDQFGYALTAWNFGNGDRSDLVIGIPYRDVVYRTATTEAVAFDAGALLVLYGTSSGLTTTGYQFWTLGSSGVLGNPQNNGRFGYALY